MWPKFASLLCQNSAPCKSLVSPVLWIFIFLKPVEVLEWKHLQSNTENDVKGEWTLQQFVSRISLLLLKLTTQAKGNSVYKQRPEHLWNSWNISWELWKNPELSSAQYLLGESLSNIVCLGNREASCYFWTGALMFFDTGWHGDGGVVYPLNICRWWMMNIFGKRWKKMTQYPQKLSWKNRLNGKC